MTLKKKEDMGKLERKL